MTDDKLAASFYPDEVPYSTHTMTPMKFGAYVTSSLRYDAVPDHLVQDQLMHRLTALVLSDTIAKDTYEGHSVSRWPATTWQMFKHRHAASWWLGWLVRRHPVRMTEDVHTVEVNVERYLLYPEANVVPKDFGRPVIYERVTERGTWRQG